MCYFQQLVYLHQNRTIIVSPVIDIIDKDTMEYTIASPSVKGGFDPSLHFKWDNMSPREMSARTSPIQPIRTPAIAGGLFAVDKDWFHHIGDYDSQMEIWGAENVGKSKGPHIRVLRAESLILRVKFGPPLQLKCCMQA